MLNQFKQGDIVFMDFNPTRGHEQFGKRPTIIVSSNDYQRIMGMAIVCPITNNTKYFPTHILLDNRTKTTGSILCEQIKSVDLVSRNAQFIEKLPNDLLEEVLDIVNSFFSTN